MLRNMQDGTYLVFVLIVHHEGEPIQVFYSVKISKCNYRDSSQIYYTQHFTVYQHIQTLLAMHVHAPLLSVRHIVYTNISCPNTRSVAIFAKIEIPGGLPTFCDVTCGLLRYYITYPITFLC